MAEFVAPQRYRIPVIDGPSLHSTAEIEEGAVIGAGSVVWRNTHIRATAKIGGECTIGAQVYVDSRVHIGNRVKVQNQVAIFGPASIEDGCFIGPGACLTNDRRPRSVNPDGSVKTSDDWVAQGVEIAEGASIGAMATIVGGVQVGTWAMVGAGAVVTRDVPDHHLVVGVPAAFVGLVCRCGGRLDDDLRCKECGRRYEDAGGSIRLVEPDVA